MPKHPRHNWSKRLPLPLVIPEVMAPQMLADVQTLMRHLPEKHRVQSTWRCIAAQLEEAAFKGDANDLAIALTMVLMLEGSNGSQSETPPRQAALVRRRDR